MPSDSSITSLLSRLAEKPDLGPILILGGGILIAGIVILVKSIIKHRERMAMIESGIHPDYPPDETDEIQK